MKMKLQDQLDECYDLIDEVSDKSKVKRWRDETVPLLKKVNICRAWFPTFPGVLASTLLRKNSIYLTHRWFKENIGKRSAILLHEYVHIDQRIKGKTNLFIYLASKEERKWVEKVAYNEQKIFYYNWVNLVR